jgi:hypothetical protein
MNIDEMTLGEIKEIGQMFQNKGTTLDGGMIGAYVIVRCRDAGVHAGILKAQSGREAVLEESRRLWYWKPLGGAKFLSGVAVHGLHEESKIGEAVKVHLTETCEIIMCSELAKRSIQGMVADDK